MPKPITLKTFVSVLFLSFLMAGCSTQTSERNPYLQEVNFSIELNLNLPAYSPLKIIGNPVFVNTAGAGSNGLLVMNSGFDFFVAFEASCANHAPNTCSTLKIDGQNAVCECEDYQYSLFTGQLLTPPSSTERTYDLLAYSTRLNGEALQIFN